VTHGATPGRVFLAAVALAALILAMALLAPTVAPERDVTTHSAPGDAARACRVGASPADLRSSSTDGCRK
jgi:hypothetical protein